MPGYSEWMSKLPAHLAEGALVNLCIPGSHNSFSYSLQRDSPIANDLPALTHLGACCFKRKVFDWSVTQYTDIESQLEHGIRYLDIRLSQPNDKSQPIRIVHGLYGLDLEAALFAVQKYALLHKTELLILDFNHFYNITMEQHRAIIQKIDGIFKDLLVPRIKDVLSLNLAGCWYNRRNIIVIYQANIDHNSIWMAESIRSPWADTNKIDRLLIYTKSAILHRAKTKLSFYNCQGILTPKLADVIDWNNHTLAGFSHLVLRCYTNFIADNLDDFKKNLNIISADFVSQDFTEFVVNLNYAE